MSTSIHADMRVHLYVPDRLYGFVIDEEGTQVFFHLACFEPGEDDSVPPVVGERVRVEYEPVIHRGSAPRADRVVRQNPVIRLEGVVRNFDVQRGWGFVAGDDGRDYYLHRSEVVANRIPIVGQRVTFYGGSKQGRPRACYVEI